MTAIQALNVYCQYLGVKADDAEPDHEMTVTLELDEGLSVTLSAEGGQLIAFARLGQAPENDVTLMEALLSANLFWRGTAGATLSLDPETRSVYMAQALPQACLADMALLNEAVEHFVALQETWANALPSLTVHSVPVGMGWHTARWA